MLNKKPIKVESQLRQKYPKKQLKPFTKEDFEKFKKEALPMFSQLGDSIEPEVGIMETLNHLKILNHSEQFYVVIDVRNLEIISNHGIHEVLGVEKEKAEKWTLFDNLSIVHDSFRPMLSEFAMSMYKFLETETKNLTIKELRHRYILTIPVKKSNGVYVWVKQMSLPLRLDENMKMVQQLNIYTIIGSYRTTKLFVRPRIYTEGGQRLKKIEVKICHSFLKKIGLWDILEEREGIKNLIYIIKGIWDLKDEEDQITIIKGKRSGITPQTIINQSKIKYTKRTIDTYNAELHAIMESKLGLEFGNSTEIMLFLKGLYYFEKQNAK